MKITLQPNEIILRAGTSHLLNNGHKITGKLIVTNQRIYFKTLCTENKEKDMEITPNEISELHYFNTMWVLPNGMNIKTKEGEDIMRFVVGPLSAIGDSLFWSSIKPMAALTGVVVVFFAGENLMYKLYGPVMFLLLYNLPHVYYRARGVLRGYRSGEQILNQISGGYYLRMINYVYLFGYLLIGVLAAHFCQLQVESWSDLLDVANFSFVAMIFAFYFALRQRLGPTRLIYLSFIIAVFIGWLA